MTDVWQNEFNELFKLDPCECAERTRRQYDEIAGSSEHILLFGAGALGKFVLGKLRGIGIEPKGFADNNAKLWGQKVAGLPVYSPVDAASIFKETGLFIITVYTNQSIIKQLQNLGVKYMTFAALAWCYPEGMLPHEALDLPHEIFQQADKVRKAFELWHDDLSREEYLAQLKWRTSLQSDHMPPHLSCEKIYFPIDLVNFSDDECFIDCGAFDGDSTNSFIRLCKNRFKNIWAIEPDPENYKRLLDRIKLYDEDVAQKVISLQAAIGSKRQIIAFNAAGTVDSSIVGAGTYKVQCVPLDELLDGYKPTYIKMDIEGAEPEALAGACRIIHNDKPVMAICLYHAQEHLWQIPLLIKAISNEYHFFLRRYSDECWELVLYAVPAGRLQRI